MYIEREISEEKEGDKGVDIGVMIRVMEIRMKNKGVVRKFDGTDYPLRYQVHLPQCVHDQRVVWFF